MDSLDRAIDLIAQWKDNRKNERAKVVSYLERVIQECQAASRVWQEYLDNPGKPGDHWTIMSWIGPDRAKQLHETNLRAKAGVEEVCRLSGPVAGRFVVLDEDVTEMAYRMLKPDETGTDAAKSALEKLKVRTEYLRGLLDRVRQGKATAAKSTATGAKPKKKAVSKSAKKKTAAPKKK